jgi:hypothetical protein
MWSQAVPCCSCCCVPLFTHTPACCVSSIMCHCLCQVIQRATGCGSQAAAAAAAAADTASSNSSCALAPSLLAPFRPYVFDPEDLSALRAADPLMPPFAVMGSQMILGLGDSHSRPDSDSAGPGAGSTPHEHGTGSTAAGAAAGGTAAGPVGVPCRRYLWGDALPLNRDHSDLIILKSLLSGHQNRAVYGLLNDSWKRAHTFFRCWQHLKGIQLEARVSSGQLASSPAAILGAVEGLEVNMDPLVTQVRATSTWQRYSSSAHHVACPMYTPCDAVHDCCSHYLCLRHLAQSKSHFENFEHCQCVGLGLTHWHGAIPDVVGADTTACQAAQPPGALYWHLIVLLLLNHAAALQCTARAC